MLKPDELEFIDHILKSASFENGAATAIHGVIPVTWMQCAVRDAHQRKILFQLKSAQALVDRKDHLSAENLALMQVYRNLVRMWAEL